MFVVSALAAGPVSPATPSGCRVPKAGFWGADTAQAHVGSWAARGLQRTQRSDTASAGPVRSPRRGPPRASRECPASGARGQAPRPAADHGDLRGEAASFPEPRRAVLGSAGRSSPRPSGPAGFRSPDAAAAWKGRGLGCDFDTSGETVQITVFGGGAVALGRPGRSHVLLSQGS